MLKVTLVEIPSYDNVLPLVSGYLQVYACQDEVIGSGCEFEIFSEPVSADPDVVAGKLAARASDVYAFSCYMWNMKFVSRVLSRVLEAVPGALVLLGGPQVMNHAADYVAAGRGVQRGGGGDVRGVPAADCVGEGGPGRGAGDHVLGRGRVCHHRATAPN